MILLEVVEVEQEQAALASLVDKAPSSALVVVPAEAGTAETRTPLRGGVARTFDQGGVGRGGPVHLGTDGDVFDPPTATEDLVTCEVVGSGSGAIPA